MYEMSQHPYGYHTLPDPDRQPQFYEGVPLKRFFAWIIDAVIVGILTFIAGLLTLTVAFWIWPLAFLIISWFYRVFTIASGSATWGMRIVGIELRDARGDRFGFGQAVVHTTAYMIAFSIVIAQLISVIMMMGTRQGQALHDLLLGSTAINAPAD